MGIRNIPSAVLVVCLLLPFPALSQFRIVSTERITLSADHSWGYPRFGPDGSKVYYTTQSYDGIWEFDIKTKAVRQLTPDPGAGYAFAFSKDGNTIAYRRTFRGSKPADKRQEIMSVSIRDGNTRVLGSARTVSPPVSVEGAFTFLTGDVLSDTPTKTTAIAVLGIVKTKIALYLNGARVTLDPFGDGSYIWPSLSPDGNRLVAYEMDRGAFVYDMTTRAITKVGRADGPSWTRDGAWLVGFEERNDGYKIVGSDLLAVSPDGKKRLSITETTDTIELFPSCSPTEDRIVCHTLDGSILLLTYRVDE